MKRLKTEGKRLASAGFTLIEVIVAMVILSISLVLVMQLFAGGLRAARTSCDYSRAVIHAKDKMGELFEDPVRGAGAFDDGFTWESDVNVYKKLEESNLNLLELKVRVLWNDVSKNPRTVELVALKAVANEEKM
jgi:general secretion pathway protein I